MAQISGLGDPFLVLDRFGVPNLARFAKTPVSRLSFSGITPHIWENCKAEMMRWIIRIFVALVACVVVAVALLFMLPADRIGQLASDQLERQTGRTLTLSGDFSPTLFPTLGVKTGAITVSNADWATEPLMVTAKGASVGVNLSALIGGTVEIETFELLSPVVHLERAEDGRVNWDLSTGATAATEGTSATTTAATTTSATPSLELGRIEDGQVIFSDRSAGTTHTLSGINGTVSLPKGETKAVADLSAAVDGRIGAVAATLDNWPALLGEGISPVDGTFSFGDDSVALKGMVGLGDPVPTIDAAITAQMADPAKTLASLGLAAPTQLTALSDVALEGKLLLSKAGVFVETALNGTYGSGPLAGKLTLTGDDGWLDTPEFATDLSLSLGGMGDLGFKGRAGQGSPNLLSGDVTARFSDLRGVMKIAGVDAGTPAGTFQTAKVSGNLRVAASGQTRLKDAQITLDQNTVSGEIVFKPADRPLIEAALSAGKLDLKAYTADTSGGSSGSSGATASGWSKEPIRLQGLDAVDADVTLTAAGIDLGVSALGKTDVTAKLRNGVLTLNLREVRAFQGALSGTISLRGGNTVAFDTNLTARDVQLEPLLGQLLEMDRLSGAGTTHLALNGSGGSLDQIMTSLSGKGDVTFGNGAIKGIDLAAMMRNLQSAFGGFEGATEFTSLDGTFSMEKGVLQNVDLSLISPLFKAAGKGSVDIGGQAMNYVVTPTRLSKDAEFSVPVIITGPWDNLKFRPDLDKLLNLLLDGKLKDNADVQKAKEKLENVKNKLKDPEAALKAKLQKELAKKNATAEQPKSLEETAKDKLEDEVGNALRKLFD